MLALSRLKSDQLEPTIFKLSSLMRYMLYEAAEEKVSLKKEIEYLQSYIDLQQQRLGDKVKVNVMMSLAKDDYEIAPMILVPFIENAFKHGIGNIDHPQIDIDLYTRNDILHFLVRNKYNSATKETKDKTSGIGLINVKRRLDLLYGNSHTLFITDKNDCFTVSLQLNLEK
jgi:sensor histidine kinase YesM